MAPLLVSFKVNGFEAMRSTITLFICDCHRGVSCLLKKTVDEGFLSGCTMKGWNGDGVQISHLLFADDNLVFCQAT